MTKDRASRTIVPASFFAKAMLPFAIPILLTFGLVIAVGESWPRTIALGSGLKLAGFAATAVTSVLVWRYIAGGVSDERASKAAALLCCVTGLMGWPVWTVGVLPSVNGFSLGEPQTVVMTLERTESTPISKSRQRNHWAWLRPATPDSAAAAGRYFISQEHYDAWNAERPATVTVTVAPGLLGAEVVTGYAAGRLLR